MAVKFSELQVKLTGDASLLEKTFREANADLVKLSAESSRASAGFAKFGSTLGSVGQSLTAAITAPLAGLGGAAVLAAEQFNKAQATIRTGTGATGQALAELSGNFRAVFRQVPQAAGEVATAIADLNTRLGLTGAPLEKVSKQVLDLARISGDQLQPLIASTSRVMGDWGRTNEQVGGTLDYLWKVSQSTGIGVSDLSQKLVAFGAPLRQMGFDFQQAAALIGKFEREGVNTELVLGGLRVALARMAREGITDASAGLEEISRRIQAVKPGAEQTAVALEYFGAKVGPDMAAAIGEGRFEIGNLLKDLEASGETIQRAGDDAKTLSDRFREVRNRATEALEPLGRELVPILEQLVEKGLVPAVERASELARWFGELDPAGKKAAVGVAAVAAAAGPLVLVLGQGLLAVNQLVTLLPLLTVAAKASAGALTAVALPVAAIGGLVTVLVGFSSALGKWGEAGTAAKKTAMDAQAAAFLAASGFDASTQAVDGSAQAMDKAAQAAADVAVGASTAAAGMLQTAMAAEEAAVGFVSLREALATVARAADSRQWATEWQRGLAEARLGVDRLLEAPNLEDFGRQAMSAAQMVEVLGGELVRTAELSGALQFPGVTGRGIPGLKDDPAAEFYEQWAVGQEAAARKAGQRFARGYGQGVQEVSTVFNDLERGLARLVFQGGKLGEVGKKAAREFGEALTRLVLRNALTPILDNTTKLLGQLPLIGKYFGGAVGGGPGAAMNPIGGGGGGAVGSVAAGWVGAAGSVATAISSIIGNVQMAGMNRTLDIIAKHTLQTFLVGEASFYMTKERLEWLNDRLAQIISNGVGVYNAPGDGGLRLANGLAGGGLAINWSGNMYGGPAGIAALTDEIVRELRRRGVQLG